MQSFRLIVSLCVLLHMSHCQNLNREECSCRKDTEWFELEAGEKKEVCYLFETNAPNTSWSGLQEQCLKKFYNFIHLWPILLKNGTEKTCNFVLSLYGSMVKDCTTKKGGLVCQINCIKATSVVQHVNKKGDRRDRASTDENAVIRLTLYIVCGGITMLVVVVVVTVVIIRKKRKLSVKRSLLESCIETVKLPPAADEEPARPRKSRCYPVPEVTSTSSREQKVEKEETDSDNSIGPDFVSIGDTMVSDIECSLAEEGLKR